MRAHVNFTDAYSASLCTNNTLHNLVNTSELTRRLEELRAGHAQTLLLATTYSERLTTFTAQMDDLALSSAHAINEWQQLTVDVNNTLRVLLTMNASTVAVHALQEDLSPAGSPDRGKLHAASTQLSAAQRNTTSSAGLIPPVDVLQAITGDGSGANAASLDKLLSGAMFGQASEIQTMVDRLYDTYQLLARAPDFRSTAVLLRNVSEAVNSSLAVGGLFETFNTSEDAMAAAAANIIPVASLTSAITALNASLTQLDAATTRAALNGMATVLQVCDRSPAAQGGRASAFHRMDTGTQHLQRNAGVGCTGALRVLARVPCLWCRCCRLARPSTHFSVR